MQNTSPISERVRVSFGRLAISLTLVLLAVPLASACRTSPTEPVRDVVVNAPTDGVVRRVLVSEGAAVDKDAAIIEIAVEADRPVASQPPGANADQARALRVAETDLASAEGEASRTTVELQRIAPLVKRGLASQAELDKARTQSQDAQERLRVAREKAKTAKENLNQTPAETPAERVIAVRVPAAGTVRKLNVHAGEVVKLGQPLATLGAQS